MKIGVDIDGVLTDIDHWRLEAGSRYFAEFGKGIVDPSGPDIKEIFGVSAEETQRFWDRYFPEYLAEPARRYAGEVLNKLREEGHEVVIITARWSSTWQNAQGELMRRTVKAWLEKNGIGYDELVFSAKDKRENCRDYGIDVMIEDDAENIAQLAEELPILCVDADHNRCCEGRNVTRVYTWYDIYLKIHEMQR